MRPRHADCSEDCSNDREKPPQRSPHQGHQCTRKNYHKFTLPQSSNMSNEDNSDAVSSLHDPDDKSIVVPFLSDPDDECSVGMKETVISVSVIARWRNRVNAFKHMDLRQVERNQVFEELFVREGANGELADKINEMLKKRDDVLREQKEAVERLQEEIETLNNESVQLNEEIQNLESEIAVLQEESQGGTQAEPMARTEQERRIMSLLQESIQTNHKLIQKNHKLIQEKHRLIQEKQTICDRDWDALHKDLLDHLSAVYNAHVMVADDLNIYKERGNDSRLTHDAPSTMDVSRIDITMQPSPPRNQKVLDPPKVSTELEQELSNAVKDHWGELESYRKFVYDLLRVGKKLRPYHRDFSTALDNTVGALLSGKKEGIRSYLCPFIGSDHETGIEQPIVYALLHRIFEIMKAKKVYVTKEQYLPPFFPTGSEQQGHAVVGGRRVDYIVHTIREHLPNLPPFLISGPVETKASTNQDKKIKKGENQCIGHVSKKLLDSLHFMGIGHDSVHHAITMSLTHVCVVEMSLTKVGTKSVKVNATRTRRIEISSDNAFAILAGALSKTLNGDLQNLRQARVSYGFQGAAAKDSTDGAAKYLNIGEMLGNGAFGCVYQVANRADTFLKIPRHPMALKTLINESEILRTLDCENGSIPRLVEFCEIEVELRSEISTSKALIMQGIVGQALQEGKLYPEADILGVMEQVYDAAKFAHEKNIVHLDIRPSNIIILGDSPTQVMLTDWGCASSKKKKISFRGCLPYAHDNFFRKKAGKRTPEDKFDWASLGFTFYTLCNGSTPEHVPNRSASPKILESRKKKFKEWWENVTNIRQEMKTDIEAAVGLSSRTQPPRNKKPRVEGPEKSHVL